MSIISVKSKIDNGLYNDEFQLLYSNVDNSKERYLSACDEFAKIFNGDRDIYLFSAPGRTEIGGNHTDHQRGCVLAGSVNLDVIAIVAKNNDNIVRIKSEGFPMDEVDLSNLSSNECGFGTSASLIRGMCSILKDMGYGVNGFDAYTTSNVLKGSGLSSSAAFEVLVGVIINGLFNNNKLDAITIAKVAQKAENVFFGKPCGLMDQMASSVGSIVSIDFEDTENPIINKVQFDLSKENHSLCIVNTGGNHANLTDDYADITVGCKKVAEFFGKDVLRQVDEKEFYTNLKKLRENVSDRAILCAIHFFDENKRAIQLANELNKDNFDEFLKVIKESGNSSFKYLQNVYSARFPNEQGLSVALALTERFLNGRGACRVHGGGFAGTIQAFVPNDILAEYKQMIEYVFGENNCYILNIRQIGGYAFSQK